MLIHHRHPGQVRLSFPPRRERGRHDNAQNRWGSGGSNFSFADGSVRYLLYGRALAPVNLWAVTPRYRTNSIALTPP